MQTLKPAPVPRPIVLAAGLFLIAGAGLAWRLMTTTAPSPPEALSTPHGGAVDRADTGSLRGHDGDPASRLPQRRGRFITGSGDTQFYLLPRDEMEDYLQRHGRTGQTLALAYLMTRSKDYLEEALRSAADPSAAVLMMAILYPNKVSDAEISKLRQILGPDDILPDKLNLYLKVRNRRGISLDDITGIDWTRPCSDPTAELVKPGLMLTMELGDFAPGEALRQTLYRHAGTGFNGAFSGGQLSNAILGSAGEAAAAGNSEEALRWLRAGAVMTENNRAGWTKASLDASLSTERQLADLARKYGIEGAWSTDTASVLQQISEETTALDQLDYFKERVLPVLSRNDLTASVDVLGMDGEVAFLRSLAEKEDYRGLYNQAVQEQTADMVKMAADRRLAARTAPGG